VAKRIVVCCAPGDDMDETCFKIPYDILIMGEHLIAMPGHRL
jgi:hypothetical protein